MVALRGLITVWARSEKDGDTGKDTRDREGNCENTEE